MASSITHSESVIVNIVNYDVAEGLEVESLLGEDGALIALEFFKHLQCICKVLDTSVNGFLEGSVQRGRSLQPPVISLHVAEVVRGVDLRREGL